MAAIGRVEVLKDGAAATYGSDAVAGVVNFITKENLRGLDVGADFKQIEDSDGDYTASGAFGWGNDRSSALFAVGYQHRSELLVRDRDWAAQGLPGESAGRLVGLGQPAFVHSDRLVAPTPTNPLGAAPSDPRSAVRAARRLPRPTAHGRAGVLLAVLGVRRADRRGRSLAGLRGLQPRHHRLDQPSRRSDVRRHGDPDLPDLAVVRGAAGSDAHARRDRRHLVPRSVFRAREQSGLRGRSCAANPGVFPARRHRAHC